MSFWYDEETKETKFGKIIVLGAVAVISLILAFSAFVIVPAGGRGVLLEFGKPTDNVLGEGLHFITPIKDAVMMMDVRTQNYGAEAVAASKDLQDTKTTVAVNFHLEPDVVNTIYRTIGMGYRETVISPAIQEVVKASTAKFNAEELITERPLVKEQIENGLKERLNQRGILVETVSITNFEFSQQFSQAIESKVTAQQLALKAENDLKRIEIEAKQSVAKAEGDANAIEIINKQLLKSPQYIQYIAVNKWNGIMPLATSGTLPFINIPTSSTLG